jgi:hypothetical protein
MGIVALVMSFFVPNIFVSTARKEIAKGIWNSPANPDTSKSVAIKTDTDAGKLAVVYQTQLIIGAAMLEGVAFFAGVAYFLERNYIALILAGIMLGCLIARFPTVDRVTVWIDRQQSMLTEERSSGA